MENENHNDYPFKGNWTRDVQRLFNDVYKFIIDSNNHAYGVSRKDIIDQIDSLIMKSKKVAAIESDVNPEKKGTVFDPILENFILGTGGFISNWSKEEFTDTSLVIRGIGGSGRKAIQYCWNNNRTFYYIDTGYFGNNKHKLYHRVTKNNLQHLGPVIKRPYDRIQNIGWRFRNFSTGEKILICPPSGKVMEVFGEDLDAWLKSTVDTISAYTDRPIEVRLKPSRTDRITTNTIEQALSDDVHCLVTYNSIAATEAIMYGKPAFTLGPNAAHSLCLSDLSLIETPKIPEREEVEDFVAHLSYCQFTVEEMKSGFAWNILNENE